MHCLQSQLPNVLTDIPFDVYVQHKGVSCAYTTCTANNITGIYSNTTVNLYRIICTLHMFVFTLLGVNGSMLFKILCNANAYLGYRIIKRYCIHVLGDWSLCYSTLLYFHFFILLMHIWVNLYCSSQHQHVMVYILAYTLCCSSH